MGAISREPWSFVLDFVIFAAGLALIAFVGWRMWGEGGAVLFGVGFVVLTLAIMTWVALAARKIRRERQPDQSD